MFKSNEIIGTDIDGKDCIAKDYVNQKILVIYQEDGKEIFFLGQYNKNYQWDGFCVYHSYYADGTLHGICESNFDNGKRLDYKSFVNDGKNEWVYSDRICKKENNVGENRVYQYSTDKVKNFTSTNVRSTDIIDVDDYMNKNEMILMSSYTGATVQGKYNDTTGNACYIRYYEDGTIKTLYKGNFVDGKLEDNTGNAWQIACDRNNGALYQFYQGNFSNDQKTDPSSSEMNLTNERIQKILKDKKCELDLNWDKNLLYKE